MPDDLKWSWCNNNNRNNVHNKCNMLESSWNRLPAPYTPPPTPHNPFHGNIVLHQTGPWCLKVRDHWRWFCQAANSPHTDALGDGRLCPGCDVQPRPLSSWLWRALGLPPYPPLSQEHLLMPSQGWWKAFLVFLAKILWLSTARNSILFILVWNHLNTPKYLGFCKNKAGKESILPLNLVLCSATSGAWGNQHGAEHMVSEGKAKRQNSKKKKTDMFI